MKSIKFSLVTLTYIVCSIVFSHNRVFAATINCDRNSPPYFHSASSPGGQGYYRDPYNCPSDTATNNGTNVTTGGATGGTTNSTYYTDGDTTTTTYSNYVNIGGGGGVPGGGGGVPGGGEGSGPSCPIPQQEQEYCRNIAGELPRCREENRNVQCPKKCVGITCDFTGGLAGGSYNTGVFMGKPGLDPNPISTPISFIVTQCRPQDSVASFTWDEMPDLSTPTKRKAFNDLYPTICTNNGKIVQATTNPDLGWFSISCQLDATASNPASFDNGQNCKYYLETNEQQSAKPSAIASIDNGGADDNGASNTLGSVGSPSDAIGSGSTVTALYSISGTVTDENGNPLANHTVFITYNDITRSVTTDANGNFTFSDLSPGTYIIRPANTDTLIFFGVDITINPGDENKTINGLSISGMSLREVKDTDLAELLRRSSESSGNTDLESGSSLNDWINNVMNGKFTGNTSEGKPLYDEFGNISNVNSSSYDKLFSSSSFLKLLSSGYLPLTNSYSPVALSLISKFANNNAICGDGIAQEGETCDDGLNNGKSGQCSADCLYFGEVRFTDYDGIGAYVGKDARNALQSNTLSGIFNTLQLAGNELSDLISRGIDGLSDVFNSLGSAIDDGQEWTKQKIIDNTSPATRKVLKKAAVVAEEVAKYSVIGVTTLLAVAAAGMQVMVYKSQWLTYTVKAGDTIDSLGNQFTMTERALRARNGHLKGGLREGMKIKVRNRHFIEKNYLDQLKSVLKDGLEKRHYGHMSAKIDKMFAKK